MTAYVTSPVLPIKRQISSELDPDDSQQGTPCVIFHSLAEQQIWALDSKNTPDCAHKLSKLTLYCISWQTTSFSIFGDSNLNFFFLVDLWWLFSPCLDYSMNEWFYKANVNNGFLSCYLRQVFILKEIIYHPSRLLFSDFWIKNLSLCREKCDTRRPSALFTALWLQHRWTEGWKTSTSSSWD